MSNKTKEEIAETFIFNQTEVGWFRDKYNNFLAGYDSRNSEIETLNARIVELEAQIESLTNKEVSCKEDEITEVEQLKMALHGICNLCDPDNQTHEHIWRIANNVLNPNP